MQPKESLQDYMQGFAVGLRGDPGNPSEVTSVQAWVVGFKAGRAARGKAERSTALGCIGIQSIRLDRRDLLA